MKKENIASEPKAKYHLRGAGDRVKKDFIQNLYTDKYTRIYLLTKSFIYSVSPDDMKDIVHEVFLTAMQTDGLENHPNIDGWLYGTTRNLCFHFNREYLRKRRLQVTDYENLQASTDLLSQLIEKDELRILLENNIQKKMIDGLNEDEKIFYYLKYCRKANTEEICSVLNIAENTVFSRSARLIGKVRRMIRKILD